MLIISLLVIKSKRFYYDFHKIFRNQFIRENNQEITRQNTCDKEAFDRRDVSPKTDVNISINVRAYNERGIFFMELKRARRRCRDAHGFYALARSRTHIIYGEDFLPPRVLYCTRTSVCYARKL